MEMVRIAILPSKEYGNGASFTCSTIVENPLQNGPIFMQNKANFRKSQMDVKLSISMDYEK